MSDWNAQTAEWYAEKYGNYPSNRLGIDALNLTDNLTLVDIGCGTGSALRHAESKTIRGKFIGIDPVPRMLEIATDMTSRHDPSSQIEFRLGSAEALPVDDASADYVLAFDSIDHWQDIDKGLLEVKRILRPNGTFVIVKDKDVPGAKQAIEKLNATLRRSDFIVTDKQEISGDGVRFHLLVVEINKSA